MKKLCLLAAVLCVLCASAVAAPGYYTIRDLPAATSPRWVAQYEAHGRLIQVDVDVIIPGADGAPVLAVEQMPPLSAPLCSQLEAWCAQGQQAVHAHVSANPVGLPSAAGNPFVNTKFQITVSMRSQSTSSQPSSWPSSFSWRPLKGAAAPLRSISPD